MGRVRSNTKNLRKGEYQNPDAYFQTKPTISELELLWRFDLKIDKTPVFRILVTSVMEFFAESINVLQTLVIALGAGLGVWGIINLLEGYGNDNPGAKSQGMKQLMAGGGVCLIGFSLVPLLANLFS